MPRDNPLDDFVSREKNSDIQFRVNVFPKLAHFVKSFGLKDGVEKFDEAMEAWRKDHERNFPMGSNETLVQTVTNVINQITNVSQSGGGSGGIPAQLQQVIDDLRAHILADVVHRKSSPVVGETDEQNLEAKTIGLTSPRYARFTHVIQKNSVPFGESLEIPLGENMIVAGEFTVAGELIVDGTFANVDTT